MFPELSVNQVIAKNREQEPKDEHFITYLSFA